MILRELIFHGKWENGTIFIMNTLARTAITERSLTVEPQEAWISTPRGHKN